MYSVSKPVNLWLDTLHKTNSAICRRPVLQRRSVINPAQPQQIHFTVREKRMSHDFAMAHPSCSSETMRAGSKATDSDGEDECVHCCPWLPQAQSQFTSQYTYQPEPVLGVEVGVVLKIRLLPQTQTGNPVWRRRCPRKNWAGGENWSGVWAEGCSVAAVKDVER